MLAGAGLGRQPALRVEALAPGDVDLLGVRAVRVGDPDGHALRLGVGDHPGERLGRRRPELVAGVADLSSAFAGILPLPYAASSVGMPLLFSVYVLAPADDWAGHGVAQRGGERAPEADVDDVADADFVAVPACWVCRAMMRLWMSAIRLLTPSIPTPPSSAEPRGDLVATGKSWPPTWCVNCLYTNHW